MPLPYDDIEKFQNTVSLSGPQPSLEDYLKPLLIAVDVAGYVFASALYCLASIVGSGSFKAVEMSAYNFLKTSHEAGVVYTELRFSPVWLSSSQLVPDKLTFDEATDAVISGLNKGNKEFGVEYSIIICILTRKPG